MPFLSTNSLQIGFVSIVSIFFTDAISMGKAEQQPSHGTRGNGGGGGGGGGGVGESSSGLVSERCSMGLSRISREFSFKCVFVFILSLSVLLSALFWVIPVRTAKLDGFDAKDSIKLSATVQASFRLQKPISCLIPHIERLEYDIFGEIGIPDSKVAILSMHQSSTPNWTDVVFGILADRINVPINPVLLSLLRSSLIDLFLQQHNLTLTNSTFGHPSLFEILKFHGGITIIPLQYASIWQTPQILFNFTINNSISEILGNLTELNDQLKFGLHLRQYETVFVQITNEDGSTTSPPVTVQASVMSDLGGLLPERLKQLAQTIAYPSAENLGLDNSVFGEVKGVVLSSYLKGELFAAPPSPSPAPSLSPVPSPDFNHPSATSPKNGPHHSNPSVNSPPSAVTAHAPLPCSYRSPKLSPSSAPTLSNRTPYLRPVSSPSLLPPDLSPLSVSSYGPTPEKGLESPIVSPSQSAPSPSSFAVRCFCREIWFFGFSGFLTFHLLR